MRAYLSAEVCNRRGFNISSPPLLPHGLDKGQPCCVVAIRDGMRGAQGGSKWGGSKACSPMESVADLELSAVVYL